MKDFFTEHKFSAPALAALIVVSMTALSVSAAGPLAGPPGGNVDARFYTVGTGILGSETFLVGSDGSISNPGSTNGGRVTVTDNDGFRTNITDNDAVNRYAIYADVSGSGTLTSTGIFGSTVAGTGVGGYSNTGYGMSAYSNIGTGIIAVTNGTNAGNFQAAGVNGVGVQGWASGTGSTGLQGYGLAYGVKGISIDAAGVGGWFRDSANVNTVNLGTSTAAVDATGIIKNAELTIAANGNISDSVGSVIVSDANGLTSIGATGFSKAVSGTHATSGNIGELGGSGYGVGGSAFSAGGYGMYGYGAGANGIGVHGQTVATGGSGVFGRSSANTSTGVYGQVDVGWTGSNAGQFVNVPSGQIARLGTPTYAVDTTGGINALNSTGMGVKGQTSAAGGYAGVQGIGPLYGVSGIGQDPVSIGGSFSGGNTGVIGSVSAVSASGIGVRGDGKGAGGAGVAGYDDDNAALATGVFGRALSAQGYGARFDGGLYGVFAEAVTAGGTGGWFRNSSGTTDAKLGTPTDAVLTSGTIRTTGTNNAMRLEGTGGWTSGAILNFGDSDYVHISEPVDDYIDIKSTNFTVNTSGNLYTSGHARAAGGFGAFVMQGIVSGASTATNGYTSISTPYCPSGQYLVDCSYYSSFSGSPVQWNVINLYHVGSNYCSLYARNTGATNTLYLQSVCFDPNA